ncbi:hypothetical protein NP493_820g01017 [Ridgeia piscesae]|uniref:ER membrane protein complex subunit 1 n=1 Tax=Ridgeia piscesae TaxID=27915 RepID=A0AAD9KMP8_RIDPI|nr:hypothetical protein NP493_820g01017 [Ridgeia piscesae]
MAAFSGSTSCPQMAPFIRFGHTAMLLYIQRTTAHFPHPPQGAVLGRHKLTGQGLLYVFNPITGKPVKGMPSGGEVINHEVLQVSLLSQMDDHYLRPIVLLDDKLQYHVYPASDLAMVQELSPSLYMFTADAATSTLTGYGMVVEDSKLLARELWSVNLQQQGIVLADRSVLYKYLNPNLAVVVAEGVDSASKGFVNVYLIDTVTGSFVFHCHHRRSRGPVRLEHSENWVTYSYWNEKNRRTEMAVLELYEGKKQSNATTFSSLDPPPSPLVMRQSYIFPGYLSCHLMRSCELVFMPSFALQTGGILELPKALLDPRRPIVPTPEHREEGIMPYMPELPKPYEAIINYNQSVYKIQGIHTAPAGLESTCLVLCYGLDLFYTRVNPSKMFDVLKEDFDLLLHQHRSVGHDPCLNHLAKTGREEGTKQSVEVRDCSVHSMCMCASVVPLSCDNQMTPRLAVGQ